MKQILNKIFISQTSIIITLIHLGFLARLSKSGVQRLYLDLPSLLISIYGLITLILVVHLIHVITYKKRIISIISNMTLILTYTTLSIYHYKSKSSFDLSVLIDNFSEIFYKESFQIIKSSYGIKAGIITLIALVLLAFFEVKQKTLSKVKINLDCRKRRLKYFLVISISYLSIISLPVYSHDEITYIIQNSIKRLMSNTIFDHPYVVKNNQTKYPLINIAKTEELNSGPRPNIFIITVESFNANFVKSTSTNGKEYTPFFNSLIDKEVYVDNFYGNSIQTTKGHFSILCGIIPSLYHKVSSHYEETNFNCLPKILVNSGYKTLFFQSFSNLSFDNTKKFMKKVGFNISKGMDNSFITANDKKYIWGWGLQDNKFYEKYFSYLDTEHEKDKDIPFFSTLTTITNHMLFNFVPIKKRKIFKSPKNTKEHFANTLRLTDEYLKTFFYELNKREYLKDSIVIITGDHSFPMSEHGNYRSEVGHFEESFRIPFLFIWNNKDKKINTKLTYSQLDIAPTLLDLLNIKTNHHFIGTSMINQNNIQHQIYLIQPYDGHHLVVLDYPLKYVKHLRSNREYIYDLNNDPMEKDNIISKYKDTSTLKKFHNGLGKMIFNQKLIQENRIWKDDYFSFNRR